MKLLFESFVLKKNQVVCLFDFDLEFYVYAQSQDFEVYGFKLQEVRGDGELWAVQAVHAKEGDPRAWREMPSCLPSASRPMAG